MIAARSFGMLNGQPISLYTLSNGVLTAEFSPYGAALLRLFVPDAAGRLFDVVLGYDSPEEYAAADGCLGAAVGRFANRIGNARFSLGGREFSLSRNAPPHHLHGGFSGFHKKIWTAVPGENSIAFSLFSPDGEEGYPGNLSVTVTYSLSGSALIIDFEAHSDRDTPVSLTNHSYFNLSGHAAGDLSAHTLFVRAPFYTPTDRTTLPTGIIAPTAKTPLDLSEEADVLSRMEAFKNAHTAGFDHNLVLAPGAPSARLTSQKTGIYMELTTTMPAMQLYSAGFLSPRRGKGGAQYAPHAGICLETQHFPDAVNRENFPSPILKKNEIYRHRTEYRFGAR